MILKILVVTPLVTRLLLLLLLRMQAMGGEGGNSSYNQGWR